MRSFLRQTYLLILLGIGFGAALAAVQSSLQPRIDRNVRARMERAILEVVPGGTKSTPTILEGRTVYRVTDPEGTLRGWGVSASGTGFQDRIDLMIGLGEDGRTITGIAVLFSNETPGLGDKIYSEEFRGEFRGKRADQPLTVIKPGESAPQPIHAITGATISSKAVTRTVNEELAHIQRAIATTPPTSGEEQP